jgi:hypothetical protein
VIEAFTLVSEIALHEQMIILASAQACRGGVNNVPVVLASILWLGK